MGFVFTMKFFQLFFMVEKLVNTMLEETSKPTEDSEE